MTDWGPFLRAARAERGWTQLQAVEAMRDHALVQLPHSVHLLRTWKRWEQGKHPGPFYDKILRRMFPPTRRIRALEKGYPSPLSRVPDAPHPALE